MGSCCSCLYEEEENRREAYQRELRSTSSYSRPTASVPSRTSEEPLFGEYRCSSCRRTWSSRLSWKDSYQICKRCRTHVFPYNQRELRPSDTSDDRENHQEHPQELCGRCQTLGHYCGRYRRQN